MRGNIAFLFLGILVTGLAASAETLPVNVAQRILPLSFEEQGFRRFWSRRGVHVYKSQLSEIVHLAAEGRFPVPPMTLQKTLISYDKQVGRLQRLKEAKVLKKTTQEMEVYQHLSLPVVSDRDYTLQVRWGQDGDGVCWVYYEAMKTGGYPVQKDAVRVTHHIGRWELSPTGQGETEARFEMTMDMAGKIPKWLAKMTAGKEIVHVFDELCWIATEKEKGQGQCLLNRP